MSDVVLVAIIVSVSGIITASISAIALVQTRATHNLINSRMDELLRQARLLARAEGVAQGEQAQRDRAAGSDS